ncbi:Protein kinase [Arachis hypogaea]|nr:Protein kinase [Arachis hypogaea]
MREEVKGRKWSLRVTLARAESPLFDCFSVTTTPSVAARCDSQCAGASLLYFSGAAAPVRLLLLFHHQSPRRLAPPPLEGPAKLSQQPPLLNCPFPCSQAQEDDEGFDSYRKGGYHAVRIGDQFAGGRYIAQRKLGWGQFSTVWLAYDTTNSM